MPAVMMTVLVVRVRQQASGASLRRLRQTWRRWFRRMLLLPRPLLLLRLPLLEVHPPRAVLV